MAAPVIRVHLVPDNYDPNLDIGESYNLHDIKTIDASSPASQKECKLIERAVDGTLSATSDAYGFSPQTLIRLVPVSAGSKTYQIDIGPGRYHDTNKSNFFTQNNWVTGNASSYTIQDWVLDHREFAPPGGEINPKFLQFQVFAKRNATFLSNPGSSSESISLNYTYIPYFGAYSFRWNETGHPGGNLNFFGDYNPVYQVYDSTLDRIVWAGGLNYTVDRVNHTITFADEIFTEELLGTYEIYVRMFIYRAGNIHSSSPAGVANSGDYVYYAIPHDDLVTGSWGSPSFTGSGIPQVRADQGLVQYERISGYYPPSGTTVTLSSYKYHRWIRIGNDMTDDFVFRKYIKAGTGTDFNEVFNYENSDDPDGYKGLLEDPPNQIQQQHVSFNYGDIKITNEATHNAINPPSLIDVFVDFLPRGNVSGTQNSEQILAGIAGLVNEFRPWDHQEGGGVETYQACFARATRNYLHLFQSPIDGYPGNEFDLHDGSGNYWDSKDKPIYDNPMSQMNAAQAWRIKHWYLSSPQNSLGTGLHFRIPNPDDIMEEAQSTSDPSISLEGVGHPTAGSDTLYARIVYLLYDGSTNPKIKTPVVTAPKAWSMRIRGDYLE